MQYENHIRTRTLPRSSNETVSPKTHKAPKHVTHSTQSPNPMFFNRQKKSIYRCFSNKLRKGLSSNVNEIIDCSVHPNFCFSQATILKPATCIAHCVSSDFAMREGLASTIACSYP